VSAASLGIAPEFMTRVKRDEPMSRHTSWHAGGTAQLYFAPRDRTDLAAFLRTVPAEAPILWVGLGSNLLVRDGGFPGVVISTVGALERLERISETTVYGEAGVACARIARQCFAGIPGTLGGALAMNAGAFGGETWRHVLEVVTLDRQGREHVREPGEYQVSYRHVQPPVTDEWFVAAKLNFARAPAVSAADVRSLLERRKATQPIGEWSCGSVFVNPPGDHAARLIEASGLKEFRLGDASVSSKHANFIINHGNATAADLERLIGHIQNTVEQRHGVRLTTEVRIVGEQL
jgi:UDP-N-acetylmuramate dehydrogenase